MTVEDLTLSRVGPSVDNLLKLMQSGGAVSWGGGRREGADEEEGQVQLAYLGSLEEMRSQLQRMCLFYQNDINVLLSLTTLLDRVDEALSVVSKSTNGYTNEELGQNEDGTLTKREEESILQQSINLQASLHNSLVVSSLHNSVVSQKLLGISGLIDKAQLRAIEIGKMNEEDEEEDQWGDVGVTQEELAQLDLEPQNDHFSELRRSYMNIPVEEVVASSSSPLMKGTEKKRPCQPTLCKICYDEYSDLSELHSLSCTHTYCKDCLQGYLTTRITSGGVLDLDCPHPECDVEVHIMDIYAVCSEDTLDKYERFVVLAHLRADPEVRWCPMPKCSAAIKGPPTDGSPWVVCGGCQLQVCFSCGDERHDPAPCGKEAKALIASRNATIIESEQLFEEWHKGKPTDVKPCPKCKAYIEKNQGCNHMTCQACKHQYCWLCLKNYEYSHFNSDEFPECKGKQYWNPPVPVDPELQARYNWIYFPPNYQYAGMEDGPLPNPDRDREIRMDRIKTKAKKVGIYVGVGVAVATLGIPAAVIGGPIYGVFRLHKSLKAKRNNRRMAANQYMY